MVNPLFRKALKHPLTSTLQPALLSTMLALAATSHARTIEGFEFPEILPQSTDHPELRLNGASVRTLYYLGPVDTN